MFLSNADRDVGELLVLPQGCQGCFRGSLGNVVFLSRRHSGKGHQLALRGQSPGFSRLAVGFLSCYEGELRHQPASGLAGGQGTLSVSRVEASVGMLAPEGTAPPY